MTYDLTHYTFMRKNGNYWELSVHFSAQVMVKATTFVWSECTEELSCQWEWAKSEYTQHCGQLSQIVIRSIVHWCLV